jgi:hypothetical protein
MLLSSLCYVGSIISESYYKLYLHIKVAMSYSRAVDVSLRPKVKAGNEQIVSFLGMHQVI